MSSQKTLTKFLFFTSAIILLLSNAIVSSALENPSNQQALTAYNFCIVEPPSASAFPDVNVVFRAYDQNLNPIANLSSKDLRISENGQAPMPLQGEAQATLGALGIDFHIVINKGNRTSQAVVKDALTTLLRYVDQSKDRVFIYTDNQSPVAEYYTPGSGVPLAQAIAGYPANKVSNYRTADAATKRVLANMTADANDCQRSRFLFLLVGDETLPEASFPEIEKGLELANAKLAVFHVPTENTGALGFESSYRSLTEKTKGTYVRTTVEGETPFFTSLASYRQSYEIKYRSLLSNDEQRSLTFVYQSASYPALGQGKYSIGLLPPQVTVSIPSIIERTALEVVDEEGFVYDVKDAEASIQVSFPDQFPRNIQSLTLIVNQPGRPELRLPVNISSASGDTYKFRWTFGDIGDARQTEISIRAEVVDELGISSSSPEVPVIIVSYKPLLQVVQRYYLYAAGGIILFLLLVVVLMWRRIKNSAVGRRITSVVENVRKTIVGAARGKPLAALKVIDGPPNMINQELKIHTESIKLGRDPQKADMTFYGADVNSSVSGLHARIERVNGAWRIVALSQSRSETFVNNDPIPFNEPMPIRSGQIIRLGYIAQQPVEFEFIEIAQTAAPRKTESNPRVTDLPRTTDVGDQTTPVQPKRPVERPRSEGSEDDIFNEYRDR